MHCGKAEAFDKADTFTGRSEQKRGTLLRASVGSTDVANRKCATCSGPTHRLLRLAHRNRSHPRPVNAHLFMSWHKQPDQRRGRRYSRGPISATVFISFRDRTTINYRDHSQASAGKEHEAADLLGRLREFIDVLGDIR